jgi:hypothetical protein
MANPSTPVVFQSRWEVIDMLFGTHLVVIGLMALALACYRWKRNDPSLISFGVFCILYGTRTEALRFMFEASPAFWHYLVWIVTYFTPLPAYLFFGQIVGPGWKSSVRRLWQLQIGFALTAVAADFYLHTPGAAMMANSVMATLGILVVIFNLFQSDLRMTRELKVLRIGLVTFGCAALFDNVLVLLNPGYGVMEIEFLGFLVFFGCLVYVVVSRFFNNEKALLNINSELETARRIQAFILPRNTAEIPGISVAALYVPMAAVAGDFYDFLIQDEERLGILVADVSGHGVPASLIGAMVKIAFSAQLPHASDPARVLCGINRALCGKLESDFITAGYLFIDAEKQTAVYAAAGHPPLMLWRASEGRVHTYGEKAVVLGHFEDALYRNVRFHYESGDRFCLYTDGVIEAANPAGERFGWRRFHEFIAQHADLPAEQFAQALNLRISQWARKTSEESLEDDLTLVVADSKSHPSVI